MAESRSVLDYERSTSACRSGIPPSAGIPKRLPRWGPPVS